MADAQADPTEVEEPATTEETRGWGTVLLQALITVIMAAVMGFIGAWATFNFGEIFAFAVGGLLFLGGMIWLHRKPIPSAALGSGLYATALLLVLVPIGTYVPLILNTPAAESAEDAGFFVGSIMGLFIWGFVFLICAGVVGILGYFANKHAKKKLKTEAI